MEKDTIKKLQMREFVVKDLRIVAKFLDKTGLKKPIFDIMFPKENPNLPKNWLDMRQHLQRVHELDDQSFKDFKSSCNDNLNVAINRYASDFPNTQVNVGVAIVDTLIDLLGDDDKYDSTIEFLAYLYKEEKELFENMRLADILSLVMETYGNASFLELLQPSIPTKTEEATL